MTTYTFQPKSFAASDDWDDPTIWSTGVVPNSADADTVFPTITTLSTGQPYHFYVSVLASEAYIVRSIQIQNNDLDIYGSLTATSSVGLQTGSDVLCSRRHLHGWQHHERRPRVRIGNGRRVEPCKRYANRGQRADDPSQQLSEQRHLSGEPRRSIGQCYSWGFRELRRIDIDRRRLLGGRRVIA